MRKTIFITGTGTDIGKTAASLALSIWGLQFGLRVAYYKPVQCGTFTFGNPPQPMDDALYVQNFAGEKLHTEVTYTLSSPLSPHLAAEKDQVEIDLKKIVARIKEFESEKEFDLVIVEGAGGAAVPFNRKGEGLVEIAKMIGAPFLTMAMPRSWK